MANDERPGRAERDKAKETVRAAFATGRIIEADHDQRLAAVDNAQTRAELGMVISGLDPDVPASWRAYPTTGTAPPAPAEPEPESYVEPEGTTAAPPPPPPPNVPYGAPVPLSSPPTAASTVGNAAGKVVGLVVAIGVMVLVVGVGIAVFLFSERGVDSIAGVGGGGGGADPRTEEGFEEMVADLEDETGSTMAFRASLFAEHGVVDVPYRAGDDRLVGYRWDGSIDEWRKGNTTDQPFDLADIDGTVLEDLCEPVLKAIEDPGDCYINIRRPTLGQGNGWLSAYVTNDFGETAYFTFDRKGNEVSRHVP